MNWQPIETAPKNGVFILLAGEGGYSTTPLRVEVGRFSLDYARWLNHAGDSFTDGGPEPTHWMPLPPPPRDEGDTFTAHGLTWRKHTPGDPMPCEGEAVVRVLLSYEMCGEYFPLNDQANRWKWGTTLQDSETEIIGWNYAD